MRMGYIGLGEMGRPMAVRLAKQYGSEVMVYNRTPKNDQVFLDHGASVASSVSEFADRELIFTCLSNGSVVRELLLGKNGLASILKKGSIVVDFSTIAYQDAVEICGLLREMEIFFLDAPISGMKAKAEDGTLSIMCGGEEEIYQRVLPVLETMGSRIRYMGGPGSGQLTKLVNQLLFDINLAALAEVLPMAVSLGLDPQSVTDIVNNGTGRSYASEFFVPKALQGDFSQGYSLQKAYKDIESAEGISASRQIPLPLTHAMADTYRAALRMGLGDENKIAMMKVFEAILGTEFRA